MPRFSANLGFLFSDRPDIERIAAAAASGFKAVEMHWPYAGAGRGDAQPPSRAATSRCSG